MKALNGLKMPVLERVLSKKLNSRVNAGDIVFMIPDRAMICDALGPHVLRNLADMEGLKKFPFSRVYATCGKNFPPRDIETANFFKAYEELASAYGIRFFGPGKSGVLHYTFIENVRLETGEIVVGTDSHTLSVGAAGVIGLGVGVDEMAAIIEFGKTWFEVPPTVKIRLSGDTNYPVTIRDVAFSIFEKFGPNELIGCALEFWDESNHGISFDDRMVLASMSAELGVVTAVFVASDYFDRYDEMLHDRRYRSVVDINMSQVLEPLVAWPQSPFNIHGLSGSLGIPINRCFIGTCSGGGLNGLRDAARILSGKQIKDGVTMVVAPQSPEIYMGALKEGLINIFLDAGAVVIPPSCGPCMASHNGILARDDVCLSTGNRNFRGRMGDAGSQIYLASPALAASASIYGEISAIEGA